MTKKKIIIDTDPGIDDALALFYLTTHPELEVLGITTIFGNVSTLMASDNARYLMHRFGRSDIPVAQGSLTPYDGSEFVCADFVHGKDGLGNTFEMEPIGQNDPRPAHIMICDLVRQHPGEITLVALAPTTNLAMALDHDPSIALLIKEVVLMGGAIHRNGNINPAAEGNVFNDPLAAQKVFHAAWKVRMFPLDVTDHYIISPQRLMQYSEQSPLGDYFYRISLFYQDFYQKYRELDGVFIKGLVPHDLLPAIYVTHPEYFTFRSGGIQVITDHTLLRGHTVMDDRLQWSHPHEWTALPAVNVCFGVQYEKVLAAFETQLKAYASNDYKESSFLTLS